MDGLVTNVSLISGVSGGSVSHSTIVLTGLAGLAAGALSMATGEFVSVSSQNELVGAEVKKERHELETNPEVEAKELAAVLTRRGVDPDLARAGSRPGGPQARRSAAHACARGTRRRSSRPAVALGRGRCLPGHLRGRRPDPAIPFLLGFNSLLVALLLAAVTAFVGGGTVARITDRPFLRGALRQLILAALAAAVTYGIGQAVGGAVS